MIPALTMKSIADEKTQRHPWNLSLTQPVRVSELVDGKFFAYLLLALIALLLTLPYYITIAFLGTVDHGTVFLGYLGLMGMAACNISIGLFASSLSYSPISAFSSTSHRTIVPIPVWIPCRTVPQRIPQQLFQLPVPSRNTFETLTPGHTGFQKPGILPIGLHPVSVPLQTVHL